MKRKPAVVVAHVGRRAPTLADIEAGRLTPAELLEAEKVMDEVIRSFTQGLDDRVAEMMETAKQFTNAVREYREEAKRLFDAVHEADFPTIGRYVREHPPSPGAIGFLILIARHRLKSIEGRNAALARHAKDQDAKRFAVDDWNKNKGEYKSKADYARIIGPTIRKRFGTKAKDRAIVGWLPKGI